MNRDEYKEAVKEAIKEWLDVQFALLGKWAFRSVIGAALAVLAWFLLVKLGWTPPGVQ